MLPGEPQMGSEPHPPERYLERVARLDVRRVGALVMAPRGDLAVTRARNDKVLALAHAPGSRFYAVCSVHPADGTAALAEVDRVAAAGARALKLHPNTQQFDVADASVQAVVARAAAHRLPVLFDAYSPFDANQAGKFMMLALQTPEARLILAHAHGSRFLDLIAYEILARYPWWKRNVWIDLSATGPLFSASPFAEQFVWVCRKVGADRLLFGSDYPLDDPSTAVERVAALGFGPAELDALFYQNAAELFGFGDPPPTERGGGRARAVSPVPPGSRREDRPGAPRG